MDLITLEVLRNTFDVIADEMEMALLKSAYLKHRQGRHGCVVGAVSRGW